ncbi:MAG: hypothetical protein ABR915_15580 [Thermoguttaceae bacterium]
MLKSRNRPARWPGISAALLFAAVVAAGSPLGAEPPAKEAAKPAALQPEPNWPIAFDLPGVLEGKPDRSGRVGAPLLAWFPPGAKHIRALFIIPNNSDSKAVGEHAAVHAVAAKREMAVVYLRQGDVGDVQAILDALAAKVGIPEIRHAPWIVLGKSSRGSFPIRMEWEYPKRTIAGISYHAETPTWPVAASAKLAGETILHVNSNGEAEWGGTWFIHVRPSLLNYRAQKNWLPHQVVAKGVGHGDYPDGHGSPGWGKPFPDRVTCIRVWDYLALFIDKAIGLRVPTDKYATDGPVELKQVDEETGYLIDPFAVEDLFRQPHYALKGSPAGYLLGEANTSTFIAIPPPADYAPPEGVPVAPLAVGRSPSAWLTTETLKFAMKNDPMTDLGGLEKLRPKPGDKVAIDDHEATFNPMNPKAVRADGGITLGGGNFTLLGYTVVDVPAAVCVKLKAPFSVLGRLQIVLGGVPVEHGQVIELQKGRYPMLLVLRKTWAMGANWGSVGPLFEEVAGSDVEQAKAATVEKARLEAEQKKILAGGLASMTPPIRKAADVPKDQRKKMFWVADREQAEAWFKLHAVHGQRFGE